MAAKIRPTIFGLFCMVLGMLGRPTGAATDQCILVFERADHLLSAGFRRKLEKKFPDRRLYLEARPNDVFKCLEHDPLEIVYVAHAKEVGERAWLSYPTQLTGQELENRRQQILAHFQERITNLHESWRSGFPLNRPAHDDLYRRDLYRLQFETARLSGPNFRYFDYGNLILPSSLQSLARKIDRASSKRLQSIKIVSCFPDKLAKVYDSAVREFGKSGIDVHFSPIDKVRSSRLRKSVVSVDFDWVLSIPAAPK